MSVTRTAAYGPPNSSTYGGGLPATRGLSKPTEPPNPRGAQAAGYGPPGNATTFGGTLPGVRGDLGSVPASVGQLLDAEGFVLVVESGDERTRFAAADGPGHGLTKLDVTLEVNNLSSWSATLPADRELFDWAFADVVLGHDGDRLYHGRLLPSEGDSSSNEVTVGGHGRLWTMTAGGMQFSFSDGAGWQAINEFWRAVSEQTDGAIRGYAVKPPVGTERRIGDEPLTFEGTPMQICKNLHGTFGYAFSSDHADRIPVVESFRPGTLTRSASWTSTGHKVALDPSSYHNRVVIRGAPKPGVGEENIESQDRYQEVAIAPQSEIEAVANGRIITHKPAPNDELTSNEACQAVAASKLEELRGEYAVTGSVSCTPVGVQPGCQYVVPEFNAAAPPPARPVTATLQSATHTLIGGASTELDFGTDRGLIGAIRRAAQPALAPENAQRTQPGLIDGDGKMGDSDAVYSSTYPHAYPGPDESITGVASGETLFVRDGETVVVQSPFDFEGTIEQNHGGTLITED